MRSICLIVLVAAGVLATTSSGAVARPDIRVSDTSPFTVRGSHFAPLERVRVTVSAKAGATRTVVANGRGGFFVRFANLDLGWCPIYSVSAIGGKGSRAAIRLGVRECPPPPPP